MRVAVSTRLGSLLLLPPGVEGRKEESADRLKGRCVVYVGHDRVKGTWRGRGVVLIDLVAGRSGVSEIWDRREMEMRLVRPACRRPGIGRIEEGIEEVRGETWRKGRLKFLEMPSGRKPVPR